MGRFEFCNNENVLVSQIDITEFSLQISMHDSLTFDCGIRYVVTRGSIRELITLPLRFLVYPRERLVVSRKQ